MYRFLFSRRWITFALVVIVMAGGCYRLGLWQWHRLENRLADNKVITKHFKTDPIGLGSVLTIGKKQLHDQQWTRISATGTYDVEHQVTVRFSTRDGAPGADVVTPLVTSSGAAILVDRGWIATSNNSEVPTNIPAPPSGTVKIQGWLRANNGDRHNANLPTNDQIRAISSNGMRDYVPYKLYDGYLNLRSESPEPTTALALEPHPELGQGPHFYYALQWWFFSGLALFGWFYLAWIEERDRKEKLRKDMPASE